MYMLVPDEPNIGFVMVAVIFVSATLLGFASAAPGGLGVFDAAMLVALWQFDKEELLAGLLLFRLLYYVIPFALSLLILGIRELVIAIRGSPPPPPPPPPERASRRPLNGPKRGDRSAAQFDCRSSGETAMKGVPPESPDGARSRWDDSDRSR